jgi:aryl-alcohol dehydrogenase-like predicted oxidoreductase
MEITRREMLKTGAGAGAAIVLGWRPGAHPSQDLIFRTIPSSGRRVPVIGIGTRNYRAEPGADLTQFTNALRAFWDAGGTVVDTAPSYGNSETIVGGILQDNGHRDDIFLATKVDRNGRDAGIHRMEASLAALQTQRLDLMQVHNLRDAANQLATLREWKESGRIGHIGVTTGSLRQYEELEGIMTSENLDFIQLNYSLNQREAADRLLPLAMDRGIAVLVNLPFGRGVLFRRVGDRELPQWAAESGIASWGQFFLKYIAAHPAITAVIPGSTKDYHVVDNMGAARGQLPDPSTRRRMEEFYDALPEPPEGTEG